MIDYYKKKSAEYHDKANVAQQHNQEYKQYESEAEAYDKRIEELEAS